MFSLRIALSLAGLLLLSGCIANTLENPNLLQPIDPTHAEIVGSKILGPGNMPDQIHVSKADGEQYKHRFLFDVSRMILPVQPGTRILTASYSGNKIHPDNPALAKATFSAEVKAGHRYQLHARAAPAYSIEFYLVDLADGLEVSHSAPVPLRDVHINVIGY